jgi:hypothetical protein
MIIRDGATVTIRARVSPNAGLNGGAITWEPVEPGNVQAETIARAVNAHDGLLFACRSALARFEFKSSNEANHYSRDDIFWIDKLRRAIEVEGRE